MSIEHPNNGKEQYEHDELEAIKISDRLDAICSLNASCGLLGVSTIEEDARRKAIHEHHMEEFQAGIL